MEHRTDELAVIPPMSVAERCRRSWEWFESESRAVETRAAASWSAIEREGVAMGDRARASWAAIDAANQM